MPTPQEDTPGASNPHTMATVGEDSVAAIDELLRGVSTIGELRARAAAAGIELPATARRLRRWVDGALRDAHRDDLERLLAAPPPAMALPSVTFEAGGRVWRLHGIAHGQRRYLRAGAPVRAHVQGLARLHDPPATVVALERGMAKVFDVDPALELPMRAREVFAGVPARIILRLAGVFVVAPAVVPFLRLSRDPVVRLMRRALRDPRWLVPLADAIELTQPPAPLHLALRRESSQVVHVLHSEAQARCALQIAREQGAADVHLVVGLAHVPDLAWLLGEAAAPRPSGTACGGP